MIVIIALCLLPIFWLAWSQWPRSLEPSEPPFLEATTLEPPVLLEPDPLEGLDWDPEGLE